MSQDHIQLALEAHAAGVAYIASNVNKVLARHGHGKKLWIVFAKPPKNVPKDVTFEQICSAYRAALPVLRNLAVLSDNDQDIKPWTLGYINGRPGQKRGRRFGNPRYDVSVAYKVEIDPVFQFLKDKRADWSSKTWKDDICEPIEEYAKSQREWLEQIAKGKASLAPASPATYLDDGATGRVVCGDQAIALEGATKIVVETLVELRAATMDTLRTKSGYKTADRILREAVNNHALLDQNITMPGKKNQGGYRTTIVMAAP